MNEKEIMQEAERFAKWGIICNFSNTIEYLMDYALNSPNAKITIDDFFGGDVCPECGGALWRESDDTDWGGAYCCDLCGARFDNPEPPEIFEYWAVDVGLASLLEEKGEIILRIPGLPTIWGRQCTGQAVFLDGVFSEIASDNIKREKEYKKQC